MNIVDTVRPQSARQDFEFEGRMRSFVGLAAVNLLLTIITLGFYRFWAKTRVRRYLWSHTRFAGDPLEYHGTGLELLIGAVLALLLIVLPLFGLFALFQALLAQGQFVQAGLLYAAILVGLFYIIGVGVYRSQRYLLSRTSWRGIRGGMIAGGWRFGVKYLGLGVLQMVTLGLATPYTAVRIWNGLLNDAEFGSFAFRSDASSSGLYPRFIGSLVASLAFAAVVFGLAFAVYGTPNIGAAPGPELIQAILALYGAAIVAFLGIAVIMAGYHAAYLRRVFAATSLGELRLGIDVDGGDLVRFYLGNAAIVVLTLGFGILVMPFRTWGFYFRLLQTSGALDADELMQTSLQGPRQGDGIADAFDLAAV